MVRGRQGERGALLLSAVALIVVIALLVVAMAALTTTNARSGSEYLGGTQAFYVAEAGLEKGIREWSLNPAYAGEIGTAFGPGSFDIQPSGTDFDGTTPLPAAQRRIISTGRVGTAARSVEVIVDDGTGNALANPGFDNGPPPPGGPDDWLITPDASDPTGGYDGGGGVGGTPAVTLRRTAKGPQVQTLADQTLPVSIPVTVATVFSVDFEYKVLGKGTIEFELYDSAGGSYTSNKINGNDTGGGWVADNRTINVPAGVTLTGFRIILTSKGNPVRQVWIDNVVLTANTTIISRIAWRENFN